MRSSKFALFSLCFVAVLAQRGLSAPKATLKTTSSTRSAAPPTTSVAPVRSQKEPRKLALLVGISQYEKGRGEDTDWWNLSCQTDVDTMRQILVHRFGFAPTDVLVLTDAKATRAGIVNSFKKHLIAQAKPGDIVVFHYSGHGQQVPDDNGDELDGMDESLIPFDYISQSARDGAKSNLRDDQLGELLQGLKSKMQSSTGKIAGNITLFFDCCFSGTATRGRPPQGRLRERGRGWNARLDGPRPKSDTQIKTRARGGSGGADSASGLLERGAALAQGYVVLSATQSDQTAKEAEDEKGRAMGAFTYYLTRILSHATPGTTYRDIFERLSVDIEGAVREQSPQLKGEIDKKLLADAALPMPRYLVVQAVDGSVVTLPVGTLQGATKGSRFALYAAASDVQLAKNKIAEAEITRVDVTSSKARVIPSTAKSPTSKQKPNLRVARAVEISHNYGESRLRVLVDANDALVGTINKLDVVTVADVTENNYDVRLRRDADDLIIERKGGSSLARITDGASAPDQLRDALLGEWRWQFLSRLRNNEARSTVKIDLRLVPVNVELNDSGAVQKVIGDRTDLKPTDGNRLVLRDGDHVMIELRNASSGNAYVTVLDLSPDGSINPIFPLPEAPGVQENRIPADNKWHRIQGPAEQPFVFRMGQPYGTEVFKVIATREPADFSPLLYAPAVRERGGANLLDELSPSTNQLGKLLLSASTGTRGAGFAGVSPSNWATAEVPFDVVPQ